MQREERPWGYFEVLAEGAGWKVKRLVIAPGQATSLQYHRQRGEFWYVVEGQGLVTQELPGHNIVTEYEVDVDCTVLLDREDVHRLRNAGAVPLVVVEIQRGSCLGEDDIVRLQDAYGRA